MNRSSGEENDSTVIVNVTVVSKWSMGSTYAWLIVKILVCLLTFSLNLLIIFIVFLRIKKISYTNFLFASMALADCLIGLISMPSLTLFTTYAYWPLGFSPCVFWVVIDYSSCSISLTNLVLISIQRLRHLIFPLKTNDKLTKTRVGFVVFLWALQYIAWPSSVYLILREVFVEGDCYFMYSLVYVILIDLFVFILPILALIILNMLTFMALKSKANRSNALKNNRSRARPPIASIAIKFNSRNKINDIELRHTNELLQISKEKKANLCLFTVALSLILCWAIFIITWPLQAYCVNCVNVVLYEIGYWLTYIQSTLNPIILFLFHKKFNAEFKRMFCFKKC